MTESDELVCVFVSQGPLGAEVARSKLQSLGIEATLRYQAIGRVLGLTVDGLGKVEVLVRPADEATARDALREATDLPSGEDLGPPEAP